MMKHPQNSFFDSENPASEDVVFDVGLGWSKCGHGRLDYKVNK